MSIKNISIPSFAVLIVVALMIAQFSLLGQCASNDGDNSASPDDSLKINAGDATEVATLLAKLPDPGVGGAGRGFLFSPNGKYLIVISQAKIHIWDWHNGRLVRAIGNILPVGSALAPEPLLYTPDGRFLLQCGTKLKTNIIARIYDPETGKVVRDVEGPKGECFAIGFSPDGKLLFWATNPGLDPGNTLTAYSTETWRPVWGVRLASFRPLSLSVSPDGKFIALGGAGSDQSQIVIIDIAQHAVTRTIQEAFQSSWGVLQLAWNPDSLHLAAGTILTHKGSDAIKIFDVRSGEAVAGETAEIAHVLALRYTPNGKYLIESGISVPSGTSLSNQQLRRELGQLEVGTGPEGWDPVIRIWDGQHQRLLQEIPGSAGNIAVTSDGHYVAMNGTGMVFIFELK